jgi:hypothetical protein
LDCEDILKSVKQQLNDNHFKNSFADESTLETEDLDKNYKD